MNKSYYTMNSSNKKKERGSKKIEERLRMLELERKLHNSGLKEVTINKFHSDDETEINHGQQESLIKRLLTKSFDFRIEGDKENFEKESPKDHPTNYKEISQASEYLEEKLFSQDKLIYQIRRDKIMLKNKLEKQMILKDNISEEARLILEKNKTLRKNRETQKNQLKDVEDKLVDMREDVNKTETRKEALKGEICELEALLRKKKIQLAGYMDELITKECDLSILAEKKLNMQNNLEKKEFQFKNFEERLEMLNSYDKTINNNIDILKKELDENDKKSIKVNKDKNEYEKLLEDFTDLKARFIEKFDEPLERFHSGNSHFSDEKTQIFNSDRKIYDEVVLDDKTTWN